MQWGDHEDIDIKIWRYCKQWQEQNLAEAEDDIGINPDNWFGLKKDQEA